MSVSKMSISRKIGVFKTVKHYFEYMIFILFRRLLLMLGLERAANFCSWLAQKLGPHLGVSRIARRNLRKTLASNMSDAQLEGLILRLWDHYGRYVAEFVYVDRLPQEELDSRIELVGLEHVAKFNRMKQPFLLCLAHIGNWDFLIRNITNLYPKFSIAYRKANNPFVDEAIVKTRASENIRLIAKGPIGAKDLVRAIKDGDAIAMLVDQKMNDGIEVPFFGLPAMTANAIAKLSLQFNMPIVPVQIIRTKGSNFKATIHPVLETKRSGDKYADSYAIMEQINLIIEGWIRQNPEQWFWFHNRWK